MTEAEAKWIRRSVMRVSRSYKDLSEDLAHDVIVHMLEGKGQRQSRRHAVADMLDLHYKFRQYGFVPFETAHEALDRPKDLNLDLKTIWPLLNLEERVFIGMKFIGDYQNQEIAETLGTHASIISQKQVAIYRRLRRLLK